MLHVGHKFLAHSSWRRTCIACLRFCLTQVKGHNFFMNIHITADGNFSRDSVSRDKSQNWSPDTHKNISRQNRNCNHTEQKQQLVVDCSFVRKDFPIFPLTKMVSRSVLSICILAVFGCSAVLSATPCPFPPHLWCSSVEISKACHVSFF